MTVRVCIESDQTEQALTQWSWVLSHWDIDQVYVRGEMPVEWRRVKPFKSALTVGSLGELPRVPLIVAAPSHGRYVAGTRSLIDFVHPEHGGAAG